eukprot:m.28982 g.28982  ORF g.28982 m.28982 type:complete len:305 (+) comp11907_c0_seq1:121-1035(+)
MALEVTADRSEGLDDGYADIPEALQADPTQLDLTEAHDESDYAQVRFAQQGASIVDEDDGSDEDDDGLQDSDGYAHLKAKPNVLRIKLNDAQRQQLLLTHGAYSSTLEPSPQQAESARPNVTHTAQSQPTGPPVMRPRSKTTEDGYARFKDQHKSAVALEAHTEDVNPSLSTRPTGKGRVRVASPTSSRSIELLAVTRCRAATSTVMEIHPYVRDAKLGDRPKLATPAASRSASDHGASCTPRTADADSRPPKMAAVNESQHDQAQEGNAAINPGYESDDSTPEDLPVDKYINSSASGRGCSIQ